MGVAFVSARSDPTGTAPEAAERAPEAVAPPDTSAAADSPAAPAAVEVDTPTVREPVPDAGIKKESPTAAGVVAPAEIPEVSIAAGPSLATEGTPAVFTLTRTGEASVAVTVSVDVTESGSMLDGAAPETVTFGRRSGRRRSRWRPTMTARST